MTNGINECDAMKSDSKLSWIITWDYDLAELEYNLSLNILTNRNILRKAYRTQGTQ
jgi:hypothetical protein